MRPPKQVKKINISYVFKQILWPKKWVLFGGLGLILIDRLAGLVLPGSSKFLLDKVIPEKNLTLLWILILAVLSASSIRAITSFLLTRLLSIRSQAFITELRAKIHAHVIRMPVTFFNQNKSGALVSRIMNDVEGVRNLVGTGFIDLVGGVLTAVASLIILTLIEPLMTLFALLLMGIFAVLSTLFFTQIRPAFRERNQLNAQVTGRLIEGLGGIKIIKGFQAEDREMTIFKREVNRLFNCVKRTLTLQGFLTMGSTLLMGGIGSLVMLFGGYRIIEETMTIGDFVAYTLYLGFLTGPILQISNIGAQITESLAGLEHMEKLLAMPIEEDSAVNQKPLRTFKGNIRFEDVSFAYEEKNPILKKISFEVKPHTTVALVGSSGAGKTTLFNLAIGFLTPTSGKIFVDGVDQTTIRLSDYRKHMGMILQDDFLFDGTLRENIIYSHPKASKKQLQEVLEYAHVDQFANQFPEGIDTVIGERGVKLSGGQKQRLSIARALLKKPKLLFLDEATSSLDNESEKYIQESLKKLMKTCTTLVIAHRLTTIQRAHQILVVENGKIMESGNHRSLIAKKGRYYRLYKYQSRL